VAIISLHSINEWKSECQGNLFTEDLDLGAGHGDEYVFDSIEKVIDPV